MRKILQVIALIAVFGTASFAQESGFGIKGGLNISSLGGDIDGFGSRISYHVGGKYEYMASDVFAIQPEVVYSREGASEDDITLALNYLNIPVVAKYYVSEGFNIQAGLQLGFLLNAEITDGNNSLGVKEVYTGTNFSLPLGVGYELESGLGFDVRYNIGLSNILDSNFAKGSSSALQLSIGYKF